MQAPALAVSFLATVSISALLPAQWHVSPSGNDAAAGTPSAPFRTIQHAASVASSGQTLFLQAGVFGDEQGLITLGGKDLVLQGAGVGATILRPHTSSTTSLPPAQIGGGASVAHRVGVLVDGPARVHLRDLTIDAQANAAPTGHLAGLYLRGGADVVVDRCALRDCRAGNAPGGRAHAVVVEGSVAVDPTTLFLRLCELRGFGDGGVFGRLRAELDLQECLAVGAGAAASVDQVAVTVADDALLRVHACRLLACGGGAGAGVRLRQPTTGCVLDANRISGCAVGIDFEHQPPSIVPGEVSHNRISAVDTAIRLSGVSGLLVRGNALSPVSRFDPLVAFDDTAAGNAWAGNRFPVASAAATAPVPIAGGGSADAAAFAGIGTFADPQRVVCGGAPVAVVAADFDGDGREDFATLDQVGNGAALTVALWRPTGYQLAVAPLGGAALRPVRLLVGEFDGAVGADVVALTAPSPPLPNGAAFWVFANDGSGGLSLLHQEPLAAMADPSDLGVVRLNGDARDDLVVVDRGAPTLAAGGGTSFVNAFDGVNWVPTPLPGTFSGSVTAVASGDLDGDLIDDVVVVGGTGAASELRRFVGDGVGGLVAAGAWPLPDSPTAVTVADHDGDGDRDVLVAALGGGLPLQRGVLQILDNVAGALQPAAALPTDHGPRRVLADDFGADTFPSPTGPDVIVLNRAASDLTRFGSHLAGVGFVDGGLVTAVHAPTDVVAADLDLDGYRDLIVAEPSRGGVALLAGVPSARVQTLGQGCPGTGGRTPRLRVGGSPGLAVQPNATLRFDLLDGFPNSVAGCAVALDVAPVLQQCQYLLGVPVFLFASLLDGAGRGSFALPLPAVPVANGLQFYAQAGVFDFAATTSFLPDFSLTAAVGLRVGN
jgi:hypothetical protein